MENDKRIELVLNTIDEFTKAELTGWSGAALHGRQQMLKEYGKYLLERVTGLPSDEFSGLHLQNVSNNERSEESVCPDCGASNFETTNGTNYCFDCHEAWQTDC